MEGCVAWCIVGVIAILISFAFYFLHWAWFKPKNMEKFLRKQGLKGNSYKFLFGDMKEMSKMLDEGTSRPINITDDIIPRVAPFYHKYATTYGENFFTWLGPRLEVNIVEPTSIKGILTNYKLFQKQKARNPLQKLLVAGVALAETDQWAKHRKIINPAFHVEKLKHMVPACYRCCAEMINKWEEMLHKESSCELDLWPYLLTFSADVISHTAFGSSFEEGKRIFELQKEMAKLVFTKLVRSVYVPGSRFLPTKTNERIKEIDREVKALISGIIDKRMAAMKDGENSNGDLLGILLDSNCKEIEQHGNSNFGLSIDEVIDECKLFYIAGQDTTATMLVWTMILLAQHTNWQTRARDEVKQVFGDKIPDADGLNHLKVVTMIFNEVLRLYPPAMTLDRMVHQETKLGDITLPAGSFLKVHAILLHHDRDLWGDDAKDFNPGRFSEGVSKATKVQASYMPFGGGPRICIAQNFALMEAKLALAMILQRFCFELSPSYSHAPKSVGSIKPQFGAHLILHKL